MLALMMTLWLTIDDVRPQAEESWLYVRTSEMARYPRTDALRLEWQGAAYSALRVEATQTGWRALFHVRARPPARLYIDEQMPADEAVTPWHNTGPQEEPRVICHRVSHAGDTLWRVGKQLAGEGDPYLFVLALFAANRELLQNDPQGLRVGDQLRCPTQNEFSAFISMLPDQRKHTYQRLLAYGERLKRR